MSLIAVTQVMADGALSGLGINPFLLIAQIVNFLLLMFFLNGMLIKPLMQGLTQRRQKIEEGLENAHKAEERLAAVEQDCQARLAEAALQAEKIKAQAHQDAIAERDRMLAESRAQVAALAMAAANEIVVNSLDERRQRAIVKDFFSKAPAELLSSLALARPSHVTVTSALPLSPDEQAQVKADLSRQLGEVDVLDFQVDPNILGGLIVRADGTVIDGSVAGRLNRLHPRMDA